MTVEPSQLPNHQRKRLCEQGPDISPPRPDVTALRTGMKPDDARACTMNPGAIMDSVVDHTLDLKHKVWRTRLECTAYIEHINMRDGHKEVRQPQVPTLHGTRGYVLKCTCFTWTGASGHRVQPVGSGLLACEDGVLFPARLRARLSLEGLNIWQGGKLVNFPGENTPVFLSQETVLLVSPSTARGVDADGATVDPALRLEQDRTFTQTVGMQKEPSQLTTTLDATISCHTTKLYGLQTSTAKAQGISVRWITHKGEE
ncbi:hypothetical protein GUITHDRAFT_118391 [Guillardia theta CCMP2712]|uniref:Uncharacterized protein n=1 Tax=Guillardia theta (strain CCMP2712) TaxID=905079 RepID=L1IHQ5_GUITC|nr:hypothetical protein GUITHDRAFT_118391 [Guillardia theta CCMP2712]EKX35474.1 hypothetical protein GUITHDRAFT_118391 [Guillardia theta CCMP2712]|eukprot:XP_005822454.1 hypothetical protein GUITHDRAFT_118391 [Guillardia theta CCMP2712]